LVEGFTKETRQYLFEMKGCCKKFFSNDKSFHFQRLAE